MNTQAMTVQGGINVDAYERALILGDLAGLKPEERLSYYKAVCESVGLNPLTKPFEYITLNGKLTLYVKRDATDQLRKIHKVSVTDLRCEERSGLLVVTAQVADGEGRTDIATGALSIDGLKGLDLANAFMKCETKSKRRATLSICGLGMLDETEIDGINPNAPEPATSRKTKAKVDSVVCASCGKTNGHESSCKHAPKQITAEPQKPAQQQTAPAPTQNPSPTPEAATAAPVSTKDKFVVQVQKVQRTPNVKSKGEHFRLTCLMSDNSTRTIYCFHMNTGTELEAKATGKICLLRLSSKEKQGDNGPVVFYQVEELLEIAGVQYKDGKPVEGWSGSRFLERTNDGEEEGEEEGAGGCRQ